MKRSVGAAILAMALAAFLAPNAATAAGRAGRGAGFGPAFQGPHRYHESAGMQQGLRHGFGNDPAGLRPGATEQRRFTYGPGDGTGNQGDRPEDGTGYGSPSNR